MTILNTIIEHKRTRLEKLKKDRPLHSLERIFDPPKPLISKGNPSIIAECKKASPSRGTMISEYDPVSLAVSYERGGASAISILTEEDFFLGSVGHLVSVRQKVSVPLLRKDFMIDPYQIKESWAFGADAILLIAAALSDMQMKELYDMAIGFGLSVLIESHNDHEIERSLPLPRALIGINSRNLKDFSIDLTLLENLKKRIPPNRIIVAESGIQSLDTLVQLKTLAFDAFLIGEFFIKSANPSELVRACDFLIKGMGS